MLVLIAVTKSNFQSGRLMLFLQMKLCIVVLKERVVVVYGRDMDKVIDLARKQSIDTHRIVFAGGFTYTTKNRRVSPLPSLTLALFGAELDHSYLRFIPQIWKKEAKQNKNKRKQKQKQNKTKTKTFKPIWQHSSGLILFGVLLVALENFPQVKSPFRRGLKFVSSPNQKIYRVH